MVLLLRRPCLLSQPAEPLNVKRRRRRLLMMNTVGRQVVKWGRIFKLLQRGCVNVCVHLCVLNINCSKNHFELNPVSEEGGIKLVSTTAPFSFDPKPTSFLPPLHCCSLSPHICRGRGGDHHLGSSKAGTLV